MAKPPVTKCGGNENPAEGDKIMETLQSTRQNNLVEEQPSFRIKDLMLGELLCQSGVLTDSRLLELTKIARHAEGSLGFALVSTNLLTSSELFVARRLVNRYLNDSDNPEKYISAMRNLLHKQLQKLHATQRSSLSLAKITRKHMATSGEALFLVS